MIFIIFSTTTLPVDDMAMRTANRRNGIKGPKLIESVLLHRYIWRCHEVGRALHIISHPEHETSVHACNVHVYCWNTICFIYTLLEYEYTTYARAISMRPSHKIQVINIQLRNRAKQNEEYALAESWWNGACSMHMLDAVRPALKGETANASRLHCCSTEMETSSTLLNYLVVWLMKILTERDSFKRNDCCATANCN